MNLEADIVKPANRGARRVESVPFSALPAQSRLFTEYQENPLGLIEFYPSAVSSHIEIASRIPHVLSNYTMDRTALCDALSRINQAYCSFEQQAANIELLRNEATVAVVTGQQAGLFTGPLYSIYKALSAIKMSECLRGRGFKAVPVFWMATEDHDFDEISHAFVLDGKQQVVELSILEKSHGERAVGKIAVDDSIRQIISELFEALPVSEFTGELRESLSSAWNRDNDYGSAFGIFLARLLHAYGLIILDPLDDGIKRLAGPIYQKAVENSREIVSALLIRNEELESAGFHAQVAITDDYFPLFWHSDDGSRKALRKVGDGQYRIKDEKQQFSIEQLSAAAISEPARFSPGVMLRAVVQDYLLPTACYFGGGAEIAYFAQNSEVYRILNRPVTPIIHRQSFTIVEPKHARTLEKFELRFMDLFDGLNSVLPQIVENQIDPQTARLFAEAEEKINIELNRLDQALSEFDPTLAENLATRRRKIVYHIGALRKKFYFRKIEKDETVNRQLGSLFNALAPNGHLQERTLNVTSFLDRYGPYFIDWIFDAIDLDDSGHRILYL